MNNSFKNVLLNPTRDVVKDIFDENIEKMEKGILAQNERILMLNENINNLRKEIDNDLIDTMENINTLIFRVNSIELTLKMLIISNIITMGICIASLIYIISTII